MKKLFLVLGIVFVVVLIAIGSIIGYFSAKGIPTYEPEKVNFTVNATPEKIERGWKLASVVCNHCHSASNSQMLTGRRVEDMDPAFGKVFSKNITKHPEHGIGKWTDSDLARFIRTGVRADGTFAPPYMPKFPLIADADLEAIIAYLRSDHPSVQPSDYVPEQSTPSLLTKILCNTVIKPFDYPDKIIEVPSINNKVEHGRYLATAVLGCFQCHSADFKTLNEIDPPKSEGFFGGGNRLFDMEGHVVYSPNITMDKETGIGSWSNEDFLQAIKYGKRPDGRLLKYPMIPYGALTDEEIKCVYEYLKTVPVISNKVDVHPAS